MPYFPRRFFPPRYPKLTDFVPSLHVQSLLDPNLPICAIDAVYSIAFKRLASTGRPILKRNVYIGPLGSPRTPSTRVAWPIFDRNSKGRKRLQYSSSSLEPLELLEFVRDQVGDCPDVAIRRLAVRKKVPKRLEDSKFFEGTDSLTLFMDARGNHARRYGQMLGMRFWNPYRYVSNMLIESEVLRRRDSALRRIRTTLITDALITDDGKGWEVFASEMKQNHIFPKTISELQWELCRGNWWQDVALLSRATAVVDSVTAQPLCIYNLYKAHQRVCYPLNPV